MSKFQFKRTDTDNLISNLRGEIGEIIQYWTLMRDFYILSIKLRTDDLQKDLKNQELNKVNLIKKKFQDDIIARLSELGYRKYGQVNFYFAVHKINELKTEFDEFESFIKINNFRDKRNDFISHKKLPVTWDEQKAEHRISYMTILKAISKALILMKKIDLLHLGELSKNQWIEMRKKRYDYSMPAKAGYLLLPYLRIER